MTIESHVQKADLGTEVELYIVDATNLGDTIYHFTPGPLGSGLVTFDGQAYIPLPLQATGFDRNSRGTLPTPTFKVANIQGLLTQALHDYDDLVGAIVTRIRTFDRFLDDGVDPDPEAHLPLDIFAIERKVSQTSISIEWELSASLDQEGSMLPNRQVLRDTCSHRYRRWDPVAEEFTYVKVTCPYVGGSSFTELGLPTASASDKCGKRVSDCKLRFGENGVLPMWSYPGVAKVR